MISGSLWSFPGGFAARNRGSDQHRDSVGETVLIEHLVFPAKERRAVFDDHVDEVVKEVCLEIEKRYQLNKIE